MTSRYALETLIALTCLEPEELTTDYNEEIELLLKAVEYYDSRSEEDE